MCYLGWGSLGVTGLIDASECIPTFGAGERSEKSHSEESILFDFCVTLCISCVCVCVCVCV